MWKQRTTCKTLVWVVEVGNAWITLVEVIYK